MERIKSQLVTNFTDEEYNSMMECRCMTSTCFQKGEVIFHMGEIIHRLGIVISGSVNIENIDVWGNKSILSHLGSGQIFGETYAITKEPLLVDAVAAENCKIFFMSSTAIYCGKPQAAGWHEKFIYNLLMISSQKHLAISTRSFQISLKKIRPRIESYLSNMATNKKSNEFDIPFNRQELAEYLNLDRSALSKELMHMKAEGLIDYHKNHFVLFNS